MPEQISLWTVVIVFTDGRYQSDVWSFSAGGALQLGLTDARGIETMPIFSGEVREVAITWKEAQK
jgi:hypothetical protein